MATALLTGLMQLKCARTLPRNARAACHPYNPVQYSDSDEVLRMKVQALANLLRVSRSTLAYTGAGLSIDAGLRVLCSVASALLLNLYIYCHHTPHQASRRRLPVPRARALAERVPMRFQHSPILCWRP